MNPQSLVPSLETIGPRIAVGFDDAAAAVPRHVVAYDAVLDPDTKPYVHHFVVYGHASRDCGESQSRPGIGALPGAIVMGWAPGQRAICLCARYAYLPTRSIAVSSHALDKLIGRRDR
eukprot:1604138-Rhodomonas_salina.4